MKYFSKILCKEVTQKWGFSGGMGVKNPPANAGYARDVDSVPGLGKPLRERNGNLIPYSCLKNSKDRGGWWATINGVAKSWT